MSNLQTVRLENFVVDDKLSAQLDMTIREIAEQLELIDE